MQIHAERKFGMGIEFVKAFGLQTHPKAKIDPVTNMAKLPAQLLYLFHGSFDDPNLLPTMSAIPAIG